MPLLSNVFRRRSRGASGLTYGLLVGLIAIAALGAVQGAGSTTNRLFSTVSTRLQGAAPAMRATVPQGSLAFASCAAAAAAGAVTSNGTYSLTGPLGAFQAYCDVSNGNRTLLTETRIWGEHGNMFLIFADMISAQTGTRSTWVSACSTFGKTAYTGGHVSNGYSYGSTTRQHYATARAFLTSTIRKYTSSDVRNALLVLQSSESDDCWAHNAESGSMESFIENGGDSTSGYAYCRGGASASKRYHLFLCNP